MKKVIVSLAAILSLTAAACQDPCAQRSDKIKSCWTAIDCSKITDAAAKTICDSTKAGYTATTPATAGAATPATPACTGTYLTDANKDNACTFVTASPVAAATSTDVSKLCKCQ